MCAQISRAALGKHICPQACDPYPKVPPGGALALFICAPSVWQEGRVRQNNNEKKNVQQGSCCPSAPASYPQVRVKKMIWKKSRFHTNKYLLYRILKIFAHRCKFLHFSLLGLIQVRGFGHNVNSCGHLVIALLQGPGFSPQFCLFHWFSLGEADENPTSCMSSGSASSAAATEDAFVNTKSRKTQLVRILWASVALLKLAHVVRASL